MAYARANLGFISSGKADDHGKLRTFLADNGWDAQAEKLADLREWRNQCDYWGHVSHPDRRAKTAIDCAKQLLKSF